MEKFNIKEHNKKYMDLSKRVLQGTYPNKKVAQMGSQFGIVVSVILIIFGGVGISVNKPYGWGV